MQNDKPIEPFNFAESVKEIRKRAMFPILEIMPLLEKKISERVYGDVTVMIGANDHIVVRIKNSEFTFGYEVARWLLYESIFPVIDDCLYKYQQEILKRYIKEGGVDNAG